MPGAWWAIDDVDEARWTRPTPPPDEGVRHPRRRQSRPWMRDLPSALGLIVLAAFLSLLVLAAMGRL